MKVATILLLLLTLPGCAGFQHVKTTTTTFYAPGHENRGVLAVRHSDKATNNSLEFRTYKAKIEEKLSSVGYAITQDAATADYIALVSYGIGDGKVSEVTTPLYGQTGGGRTYSSGTVYGSGGPTTYSGSAYTMPTYGVIGATSSSRTTYTRSVAIDIVDAPSLRTGQPKKMYEIRAKSSGSCGAIAEVFDEILEAMFREFPGESGRSKTVSVSGDFNC